MVHEGGCGGGFAPPGFCLSFLLVHPLLRRVAGTPDAVKVTTLNIHKHSPINIPSKKEKE